MDRARVQLLNLGHSIGHAHIDHDVNASNESEEDSRP